MQFFRLIFFDLIFSINNNCIVMNQVMEQSNTELLRSYFVRKVGERDMMMCRLCKKELSVPSHSQNDMT